MKNIFKIISILLLIPLVFSSCRDEQYDDNWKSADPSFTLYNTTLTSNVLYPTMENNPFRLTWDNSLGGTTYNVVFSTTSDFATKIAFGQQSKISACLFIVKVFLLRSCCLLSATSTRFVFDIYERK